MDPMTPTDADELQPREKVCPPWRSRGQISNGTLTIPGSVVDREGTAYRGRTCPPYAGSPILIVDSLSSSNAYTQYLSGSRLTDRKDFALYRGLEGKFVPGIGSFILNEEVQARHIKPIERNCWRRVFENCDQALLSLRHLSISSLVNCSSVLKYHTISLQRYLLTLTDPCSSFHFCFHHCPSLNMQLPSRAQPPAERAAALVRLMEENAQGDYIGESISQLEHSLQCAHLAVKAGKR